MPESAGPTLVIADYPVGYASGFGETLYNLFKDFPDEKLWSAHPGHLAAAEQKKRGQSVALPSPSRPRWLNGRVALAYYPLLKAQQFRATRETVRQLAQVVEKNSIRNLLVVPVTPWILSAALALHRRYPKLNLVFYVMDDWQGHHECHQLPYSRRRQRLLREAVDRANTRFAVSREMAAHYEQTFGKSWAVVHNGVANDSLTNGHNGHKQPRKVLLAGDVNVFRFDAVIAFAEAIERYNKRRAQTIEFNVMGDVAEQHGAPLSNLRSVKLLARRSHAECLEAMRAADLLYLPLAFCKRSARISLYSLPTKLPEYLASGKSIFFHAPKESAVFRVAERYDLNPRLASIEPDALDAFVEEWAERISAGSLVRARSALREEFDIDQLATRFQSAFI
ncbi:MAG TPA: glycosyltransferase [Pyrinomonadaceae bacterium]|nr:glycosyltransferase [Pyrinomonadaceae bacterium]